MANPTPIPTFLYKILPPSPTPPSPLPEALPLLALDAHDGFIHLSTSRQVLRTLNSFFASAPYIYILRIPYARVEEFIKWEDTKGNPPTESRGSWDTISETGYFPHIYANDVAEVGDSGLKLGRDEVDEVGKWSKVQGAWGPEGWPFSEDLPQ